MRPIGKWNKLTKASRIPAPGRLIVLSISGVCLLVTALCSALLNPMLLYAKYVRVSPGSMMHTILTGEIVGARLSAHLFNVTNAQRFLSGLDRNLKVQEVGPFTYQERRYNTHFEVDELAQVLRYQPIANVTFVPELSVADPKDVNITTANTAFLSIAAAISSYPYWGRQALDLLTARFNSEPIVTLPAHDYLWGYHEPLLTFGHSLMPGWITFKKMGLLDRLYDNTQEYRLELSLEERTKFQVRAVNGRAGLPDWGYDDPSTRSRCNSFEDTYEGFGFPPGLTPERPLRIYRNLFCRILELEYVGTRTLPYGPEAYLYRIGNRTYGAGPDKQCLCARAPCRDGMSDLSPCFFGLPATISNAHFYGAEAGVHARVEGLAPDEAAHGGTFLVDPILGGTLATAMTFQLNVPVPDVSFNGKLGPFSNITVPVAYFKVTQPELDDHLKLLYWLLYAVSPVAGRAVEAAAGAAGLCLLALAARTLYRGGRGRGCGAADGFSCGTPLVRGQRRASLGS